MKSTPELEAEIVRLYYAEHWPVGTIATQLEAHVDQVRRVLALDAPRPPSALRPRVIDPYRPFIDEQLRRYPKLLATRLYDMVCARGFSGSVRTVRDHVATVRPRLPREAYLMTETLPGEVAQVDWAHVGEVAVPGGVRALWLFVLVFAYSRAMWGEFVIDLTVHSLCRSLVRAARALGGVTRQWLFDNPKTVVLERVGTVARFHPTLLTLCAAMRVEPKLCAVRKPRQKGKVERAIRYLRDRFLAGRAITGIDQGNRLLAQFIAEIAHVRPHPTIAQRTVGEVFAVERPRLLALPEPLPETTRIEPIKVDRPFAGPEQVFKYLGRYTHRVGISNHRLVSFDEHGVCSRTKNGKRVTVAPAEFIRRFLLHVLPNGFVKIRHYGLLASSNVHTKLAEALQRRAKADPLRGGIEIHPFLWHRIPVRARSRRARTAVVVSETSRIPIAPCRRSAAQFNLGLLKC